MKGLLSPEDRKGISAAVAEAERETQGEIVTAIIPQSDDYAFRELLYAVMTGLLIFGVLTAYSGQFMDMLNRIFWLPGEAILVLLIGSLALLGGGGAYFLFQIPFLDRLIAGKKKMAEAVRNRALRYFVEGRVYETREGSGVLLFISVLERRVELIADRGINEKVAPERWQGIISALVERIRYGKFGEAIEEAVREIGKILAEHMPPVADDENELADSTVELEDNS